MKVSELIKKLQGFDGILEVFVKDYEGGWDKVEPSMFYISAIVEIEEDDKVWFWGDYEEDPNGNPALLIDYSKRE